MNPLALFIGFFALALSAVVLERHPWIRRGYAIGFLGLVVAFGVTGRSAWPFYGWHLYAFSVPESVTFHEIRVADAAGAEIKYDTRAIPPSLPTPLRRLAGEIEGLEPGDREELLAFLLLRARAHRERVERGGGAIGARLALPAHQYGVRWTHETLETIGPFASIRVYAVSVRLSPDRRGVVERHAGLVAAHPAEHDR